MASEDGQLRSSLWSRPGPGGQEPNEDDRIPEPWELEDSTTNARRALELAQDYDALLGVDLMAIDAALAENAKLQARLVGKLADTLPDDLQLITNEYLMPTRTPYFVSAETGETPQFGPPAASSSSQNPRLRAPYLLFNGNNRWLPSETDCLKRSVPKVIRQKSAKYFEQQFMEKQNMSEATAKAHARIKAGNLTSSQLIAMVGVVMDPSAWQRVAVDVKTRSASECQARWINHEAESVNRNSWTEEQKDKLVELAAHVGETGWLDLSRKIGNGRTAIDCFRTYQTVAKERGLTIVETTAPRMGHGILWGPREKPYEYDPDRKKRKREQEAADAEANGEPSAPPKPTSGSKQVRAIEQKPTLKKGRWTKEEDKDLVRGMALYGTNWSLVQLLVPSRTDTQCRERYLARLSPDAKTSKAFTPKEQRKILELFEIHGRKWSLIAAELEDKFTDDQCRKEYEKMVKDNRKLAKRLLEENDGQEEEGGGTGTETGTGTGTEAGTPRRVNRKKKQRTDGGPSLATSPEAEQATAPAAPVASSTAAGNVDDAAVAVLDEAAVVGPTTSTATTSKRKPKAKPASQPTSLSSTTTKRKVEPWTEPDIAKLQQLVAKYGRQWSLISAEFDGKYNKDRLTRKWNEISFKAVEAENAALEGGEGEGGEVQGASGTVVAVDNNVVPTPTSSRASKKRGKPRKRRRSSFAISSDDDSDEEMEGAEESQAEDEDEARSEDEQVAVSSTLTFAGRKVYRRTFSSKRKRALMVKLTLPPGAVVDGGEGQAEQGEAGGGGGGGGETERAEQGGQEDAEMEA